MSTRTRIKICGLTAGRDVEQAISLGADMLGFVLDRGPCKLSLEQARALIATARTTNADITCVAVVGTMLPAQLAIIGALGFDAFQMEASAYDGTRDPSAWALPAFFDDGQLVDRVSRFRRAHRPRFDHLGADGMQGLINVDGRGGGGTGSVADWQAAASLASTGPLMLAGGLTVENVGRAMVAVRPAAVDVSSGVECAPGRKDPNKLRAFVAAVHSQA